jgi:hypothetical protein
MSRPSCSSRGLAVLGAGVGCCVVTNPVSQLPTVHLLLGESDP